MVIINDSRALNWNMHSIKNLRRYLGKSQVELSRDLGVRQQTISEWETGVYEPRGGSITLLNIISSEIGFDIWYSEKFNGLPQDNSLTLGRNRINSYKEKFQIQKKEHSNNRTKNQKHIKIRNNLNNVPLPM